MKTENFDDAVRKKIESINPEFNEEDIDKVHRYVNLKRTSRFKQRYGLILVSSLGLLVIAGLLSWNIVQQQDRKQLTQIIDTLRSNLAQTKANIAIVKTDTVFVKEYIRSSSANRKDFEKQAAVGSGNNNLTASRNYVPQNKTAHGAIIQEKKSFVSNNSYASNEGSFKNNKRAGENNSDNKMITENKSSSSQSSTSTVKQQGMGTDMNDKLFSKSNSNLQDVAGSQINVSKNEESNKSNAEPSASLSNQITKDSIGSNDSSANKINPVASDNLADTSVDSVPYYKNQHGGLFKFIKGWSYQAGLGFEAANGPLGYSVLGEINFTDKWSMGMGVSLVTINNEKYDDDDDFYRKKGQDFRSAFNPLVTDTSFISGIEIRNTLVQIPLSLTYHSALKNNFSLLFGLNTDLDLYSKQRIGYRLIATNYKEINKKFEINYSSKLFNNISLSVGIQKEWDRFIVRADPFISSQLTPITCKREDLYYGIRLGMFYSFGI